MKTTLLLAITLSLVFSQVNAQKVMTKFKNEVCECLRKMKPETMNTSTAVKNGISDCFTTAATANQQELKKQKVIDLDNSTEQEAASLWKPIFEQCIDVTTAAFGRLNLLEKEAIDKSFEGIITYVQDIKLSAAFEKMGITKKMMTDRLSNKGEWFDTLTVFYWAGNYAKIGNNANVTKKIYHRSENIIYSYSAKEADVCSVQEAVDLDLSGNPDKPSVIEIDSAVTIMGIPVKIIRMKWKMSQIDYYYNATQVAMSPDLFSEHSSEALAAFITMTKCLPLQIVTSVASMFVIIQTAANIKPVIVDEAVFTVPELVDDESLNLIQMPGLKRMRIKK